MLTVDQAFNKVFNGQTNFMTPTIKYRKIAGNFGIELSSGRGLSDNTIYGVTVISDVLTDEPKRESGVSRCFVNMEEAEEYITTIERQADA